MKIRLHPSARRQAGTLIAVLLLAVVFAGMAVSFLLMVNLENAEVSRSQTWNTALVMAESGVEDAFGFMNKNNGTFGAVTNWNSAASLSGDKWTTTNFPGTAIPAVYMHRVVDANIGY